MKKLSISDSYLSQLSDSLTLPPETKRKTVLEMDTHLQNYRTKSEKYTIRRFGAPTELANMINNSQKLSITSILTLLSTYYFALQCYIVILFTGITSLYIAASFGSATITFAENENQGALSFGDPFWFQMRTVLFWVISLCAITIFMVRGKHKTQQLVSMLIATGMHLFIILNLYCVFIFPSTPSFWTLQIGINVALVSVLLGIGNIITNFSNTLDEQKSLS